MTLVNRPASGSQAVTDWFVTVTPVHIKGVEVTWPQVEDEAEGTDSQQLE